MNIPSEFKLGLITYKVELVDKLEFDELELILGKKISSGGSILFDLCDPAATILYLATEDFEGKPLQEGCIEQTFYRELAYALVGETAFQEANQNEIFIDALGKNIYNYITSVTYEGEEETETSREETCNNSTR